MNDALLQIRDLHVEFQTGAGPARAVNGVSFSIRRGELFAVVGESGSGKSVTALSILGLLPAPASRIPRGEILFGGRDLLKLTPAELRSIRGNQISMIFQEPMTALNPVFTVGEQIGEVLQLHQGLSKDDARRRTVALLERVGIPDPGRRVDEYPHQLSGGMRQRVMIAMAVGCHPALLIADEPTTALDVTVQAQVFELLRERALEQDTAVLLITHDMGIVKENARRVAVMYGGRIVEEADRDDLFRRPSHPYTQLLLQAIPSRSHRGRQLATIEGVVPAPTDWPPGCPFANRCPRVMDRCRERMPADVEVAPGHRAACFLLEDAARPEPCAANLPPVPPASRDESTVRLEVSDLQVHFPIRKGVLQRVVGHVKAVDGVTLKIHKGETLALVGESGCGKTTVGKGIARLSPVTGGSVRFHGDDIARLSRRLLMPFRRRIQVVFQDPQSSLNPRMMIGDILREGLEIHGIGATPAERHDRVERLLERVGLRPEMMNRYPHEFSGGQRQRIGLARALSVDPELIVCDEATSSLDVSVQAQALNLLKKIQSDSGISYLFITHDMSVVRYLADRVSVMYLGRIVEEGTVEELFAAPRHPYTQALLSAVPKIDEDGRKRIILEGDVPSPIRPPSGCHFHPRCPFAMPVCRGEYPPGFAFSPTHASRCWLHDAKQAPAGGGAAS